MYLIEKALLHWLRLQCHILYFKIQNLNCHLLYPIAVWECDILPQRLTVPHQLAKHIIYKRFWNSGKMLQQYKIIFTISYYDAFLKHTVELRFHHLCILHSAKMLMIGSIFLNLKYSHFRFQCISFLTTSSFLSCLRILSIQELRK